MASPEPPTNVHDQRLDPAEDRYRILFDSIDQGFCIIDMLFDDRGEPVDYRFVEANPAFEEHTGIVDGVGKRMLEIEPHHEKYWFEIYGEVALTGEPKRFVEKAAFLGGRWFDVNAFRIGGADSRRVGVLFADITEKKTMELALRESEALYRAAVDQAAAGIVHSDLKGKLIGVNDLFCDIVGRSRDELLQLHMQEITDERDLPHNMELFQKLVDQGTPFAIDKRYVRPDATTVWVRNDVRRVSDRDGTPLYIQAVVQDISERKRREQSAEFVASLSVDFARLSAPEEIMQVAGERIASYLGASSVAFAEIDESEEHATVLFATQDAGDPRLRGRHELRTYMSEEYVRQLRSGQPVAIDDVQADPRTAPFAGIYQSNDVRAQVDAPHLSNGRLGFLLTVRRQDPYPWPADEVELLCDLAARLWLRLERARAEETARANEAQLQTLFDNTPLGVYLVDAEFRLRQFNPTAASVFAGIPDAEGKDFSEVVHILWPEEFADDLVRRFRHTLETGEPYSVDELTERRNDLGVTEFYEWQINRIPLSDGRYGVVAYFRDISERMRARQAIQESEERYRTLFESVDQGFCVFEMLFDDEMTPVDYRFLEINPTFEKQTGLRDAVGKTARELVPDLNPEWFEVYGNVALTGEPVRFEEHAPAMDGRWFDVYAFRVGLPRDRKVGVLFKDITESKNAEQALRDSEERFRTMADTAPAMLWVTDTGNAATYLSKGWLDYTGQNAGEATSFGWLDAVHPDDRDNALQRFVSASNRREPFTVDYRVRRGDGVYRWINETARPWFGEDGDEWLGYIGSITEIHDRKQVEEALATELAAMQRLHKLSTKLTASADLKSLLKEVLDAAVELQDADFGTVQLYDSSEAALQLQAQRGFDPEFVLENFATVREADRSPCALAMTAREQVIIEDVDNDPRVGDHRDLAVEAGYKAALSTPLVDRAGELIGMLTTHFARPHRPSERELRLTELYARQAGDMITAKLTEDALRESARLKDELLGLISHEFRNPLTTVVGHIGVLARDYEGLDTQTRTELIDDLRRDSARLRNLIENMLLLSKAEAPEDVPLEPLLLHRLLPPFVAAEQARDPSRAIRLDMPADVPPVLGSAGYMEQILENLVTNSRKYGDPGTPIDIVVNPEAHHVSIAVCDRGEEQASEDIARFFEPFFRSSNNPEHAGGMGLGMSVCARLVDILDGELEVLPREGGGLKVSFTLPAVQDDE